MGARLFRLAALAALVFGVAAVAYFFGHPEVAGAFLLVGTGAQKHRLKSGGLDSATLTQGSQVSWDFADMPTRNGKLPYYVPYLLITLGGNWVQSGATGVQVNMDNFFRMLIGSFQLQNMWRGTPYNTQMALGAYLPIFEYLGVGYRFAMRKRAPIAAGNGTYPFQRTFAIPLAIGQGRKPWKTAPLAIEFKNASLIFNLAAAAVATTFSPGTTFTSLTMRVSAVLDPKRKIVLGPGAEWIDYQSTAASSQTEIVLRAFGNTTGLLGTDADAGVVFLGALTSLIGLGGSFLAGAVTRYANPWRNQLETQQIPALVSDQIMVLGSQPPTNTGATGTASAYSGFPYVDETVVQGTGATLTQELDGLMFLPMVVPGEDLKYTELQIAYSDQAYLLAGPSFSGTNHTVAQHARSWSAAKRADFEKLLIDSGLAKDCLGWKGGPLKQIIDTEIPAEEVGAARARFLPRQFVA